MKRVWALALCLLLVGCPGATTIPAMAVMGYDQTGKRARLEKWAEGGDVYAQYDLARSYCCRQLEGELDAKKSLKWHCAAAKNGHSKAQLYLGKLYQGLEGLRGVEIEQDLARAQMWYTLASRRGLADGSTHQKNLAEELGAGQKETVAGLLAVWKTVPCGVE